MIAGVPGAGRHRVPEPDPLREYSEPMLPGEVAAVFGVTVKTLSRWTKECRIGFIRTLGGHRRYPKDAVRAAMLKRARNRW